MARTTDIDDAVTIDDGIPDVHTSANACIGQCYGSLYLYTGLDYAAWTEVDRARYSSSLCYTYAMTHDDGARQGRLWRYSAVGACMDSRCNLSSRSSDVADLSIEAIHVCLVIVGKRTEINPGKLSREAEDGGASSDQFREEIATEIPTFS